MSAIDYPTLRPARSASSGYSGSPNTFPPASNLLFPSVNACTSGPGAYPPPPGTYSTNQTPFSSGRRRESTTDDEYDGEEFDDDSSALVTPPMASPLIKRRDGDERREARLRNKEEGETIRWDVNGAGEIKVTPTEGEMLTNGVASLSLKPEGGMNGTLVTDTEPPSYQALLDANSFSDPLGSEEAVVLSAASEIVSPASNIATLASPVLQRSDSVKFCRSSNGNAQRGGHGSSVAGMAGSNPASGVNRPARRVPSLKLKRLHVLGSRGGGGGGGAGTGGAKLIPGDTGGIGCGANNTGNLSAPTVVLSGHVNPSITITLDSDSDSVYSDYLSPEINYKTHEGKLQLLGDENSLYGTPKEEAPNTGDTLAADGILKASSTTSYLREQIMNFFQPSDNKLAMKLFGNRSALIKEKMRHKRVGNWVIHPCSNFR
ncbi:unnamed protein product [Candidula unifasciata]|uniref:Ion transport N-terminal domain-containing protein n=1 Tax=Candidula unifasciata TaxID=100452 RepID=A0A8S3ZXM9_9EUPU|nr:unnamed protein product [Candidula unifasciata]